MKRSHALVWVLVLGCVERPAAPDEAGVTTNLGSADDPSSSSDSVAEDSSTTLMTSTDTDTDTDTGDGDGDDECPPAPKLDLPPDPDPQLPDSYTIELVDWGELGNFPGCTLCDDPSTGCAHQLYLACTEPEPGQTCAELCPSGNCVGFDWSMCMGELDAWGDEPSDWCGHYEIDGKCCTLGKLLWVCAE